MRNLLRALALLLPSLLSSPASASGLCLAQDAIARSASLAIPQSRIVTLGGAAAERFLAAYNAYPPRTRLARDRVMIIDAGAAAVLAVLFEGGCATRGGRISRPILTSILARLAGYSA